MPKGAALVRRLRWKLVTLGITSGLGLVSATTGCVAQGMKGGPPTGPTAENPQQQTTASASSQKATYTGAVLSVQFSFEYPPGWSVSDLSSETNGLLNVMDERNARVASLVIQPYLEVEPCRFSCADAAVSYLGEVPGQSSLGGSEFVVQTKAMDLTSRKDQRDANGWPKSVLLVVGVEGGTQKPATEDPTHFGALAGIRVTPEPEGIRTIRFMAVRSFDTLTEARSYTSTNEHGNVREMLASFTARPQAGQRTDSPTPGPS